MPAPRIRADHDQLARIATTFGRQSESARRSLQRIQRQVDILQGGDWIGKGAQAFYKEMDQDVLPALTRLTDALSQAQKTTAQISQILKQAEEDAARFLRAIVGGDGRGADGAGGALDAGGFFGRLGEAIGATSWVFSGLGGLLPDTRNWIKYSHQMAQIFAEGGEAALQRTGIAQIVAKWQAANARLQPLRDWGNWLNTVGAGFTGLGQGIGSGADTLVGKIVSGGLAGGAAFGAGQSPWATAPFTSAGFMRHNGYFFAADMAVLGVNTAFGINIDRPTAIVNTAIDNIVTTAEGFVTGSSEGWARIHQRNLSGESTWVFQKAAEAGEFYAEHGVVAPLKEIGNAVLDLF